MRELPQRLLDVLKETLIEQSQIRDLLDTYKQMLIQGRNTDTESVHQEVDKRCQTVVALEHNRQTVVSEIAQAVSIYVDELTATKLVELPFLLSVREELSRVTSGLRQAIAQISQLRDEIVALAQQTKDYFETMFNAIQESHVQSTSPYAGSRLTRSQFVSVKI